jgi:amidohydrolase
VNDLTQQADELAERIVGWRRELHQHPELGFEEKWTSDYVVSALKGLDLEVHRGIAGTGVAAVLRAANAKRPAVLLRADMDALPIQEIPGRPYGSQIEGKMHACGHDGHMAMLLGAARLLDARRDQLDRDVVLCFQPAEEGFGGGEKMIQEGVLELTPTEEVYALHLWSPFDAGTVHLRSGPIMAAEDGFKARLIGRGGHAAMPHTNQDPIVAAAHAVTALQMIVSRNVDPVDPAVVSVGQFHAGTARNITPDEATLSGTIRTFTAASRDLIHRRIVEVIEGAAQACGCSAEVEIHDGYPATVNDRSAVDRARALSVPIFGSENVIEPNPMAPAEDFSYFLKERAGAFILVGAGNAERGIIAPHHSPQFDIDESVLPRGAQLLASLALAQAETV